MPNRNVRRARPPVISLSYQPAGRLMKTRGRVYWRQPIDTVTAIATHPRRRSVFAAGYDLRLLARRRTVRRRVAALGLVQLRPGLWYDVAGDVRYGVASSAPAQPEW